MLLFGTHPKCHMNGQWQEKSQGKFDVRTKWKWKLHFCRWTVILSIHSRTCICIVYFMEKWCMPLNSYRNQFGCFLHSFRLQFAHSFIQRTLTCSLLKMSPFELRMFASIHERVKAFFSVFHWYYQRTCAPLTKRGETLIEVFASFRWLFWPRAFFFHLLRFICSFQWYPVWMFELQEKRKH